MADSKAEGAPSAAKPKPAAGKPKSAEGKSKPARKGKGKFKPAVEKKAVDKPAGEVERKKPLKKKSVEFFARVEKIKLERKQQKKSKSPRNYDLGCGVYRYSRPKMYKKKALYRFIGKPKTPKKPKPKKPTTIVKPIGGEKNGGTRTVLLKKRRNYFPTADKIKPHRSRNCFSKHKRYTRKSLRPGTVCIILAGVHKGKRVVLLKVLKTGLLLITGPHILNGCPLRRVSQRFVIATATRISLVDVKVPEHIDDKYFRRERRYNKKKPKKEEGDIFSTKKEAYKVSDQRKEDQKVVDKQVLAAIKKRKDRRVLYRYLSAMFGLRSSQCPHRMNF